MSLLLAAKPGTPYLFEMKRLFHQQDCVLFNQQLNKRKLDFLLMQKAVWTFSYFNSKKCKEGCECTV